MPDRIAIFAKDTKKRNESVIAELLAKQKKVGVIGLGYVGLPIALAFAKKLSVVGYDISSPRIEQMRLHKDPNGELPDSAFHHTDIYFTTNPNDLKDCQFFIVAVPTPIDEHNNPDLSPLLNASETLAKLLKKGDYVVYESTVYPGCTEEDCVPKLEQSGFKYLTDFKVGFSPERINPGDTIHTLQNTVKIVSGCDAESLEVISSVYGLVIEAGIHQASSIKVAEAAKIIENTQRDINIAFMNELSLIFDKMGINTYEVIEAASTKWNFIKFVPGLVGGHCIGVDPYYLTHKANALGYHAKMILAGRDINDSMGAYIGNKVVKKILETNVHLHEARVLVMGITFKENVKDIRNSKVIDLIRELESYKIYVDVTDPLADAHEVYEEYGIQLKKEPGNNYHAIILAVAHDYYKKLSVDSFYQLTETNALFVDIKGIFRGKINSHLHYWSL